MVLFAGACFALCLQFPSRQSEGHPAVQTLPWDHVHVRVAMQRRKLGNMGRLHCSDRVMPALRTLRHCLWGLHNQDENCLCPLLVPTHL